MFLIDGDYDDIELAKDAITDELSEEFETKVPRVDAHACRYASFYQDRTEGTVLMILLQTLEMRE